MCYFLKVGGLSSCSCCGLPRSCCQGRVGLAGQGLGGGPRASVPGGVGGRHGPQGRSKATCVVFLSFHKKKKNGVF